LRRAEISQWREATSTDAAARIVDFSLARALGVSTENWVFSDSLLTGALSLTFELSRRCFAVKLSCNARQRTKNPVGLNERLGKAPAFCKSDDAIPAGKGCTQFHGEKGIRASDLTSTPRVYKQILARTKLIVTMRRRRQCSAVFSGAKPIAGNHAGAALPFGLTTPHRN